MVRDDEVSADDLRVRERAVVEALRAHLWVDEFVARRPRASEASVRHASRPGTAWRACG